MSKGVMPWAGVVVSALLQVLCFPIAGQVPAWRCGLGWIALIPWLMVLCQAKSHRSLWQDVRLSYACGVLWYLFSCGWIYQTMNLYGGLPKPVALGILVLFSLYLGIYHGLFGLLFALTRRSRIGLRGALSLVPFFWVAVELARARVTGFPWDLLGYVETGNLLTSRVACLSGVMGLSFLVAAVNALLCWTLLQRTRKSGLVAGTALSLVVAFEIAGRLPWAAPHLQPGQRAVMVQDNLAVGATAGPAESAPAYVQVQQFGRLALQPSLPAGLAAGEWATHSPTIVLFPEAPSRFVTADPIFRAGMGRLAQALGAPVIAGADGLEPQPGTPSGYEEYVSAAEFAADGTYDGRYDKIRLVPWGEYVPYKELFGFASSLTGGVSNFTRGKIRSVFSAGGHRYGVFLCYESIFGDEVREFVRGGADVLVNLSDDGWYGDSGAPWQHLNMARMRAIENHRWVLRDTNTGETTAIDPWGRYVDTPRHVRTAYLLPFDFETGETLYTRWGDWWAWVCVAVGLCGLGWGLAGPRRAVE